MRKSLADTALQQRFRRALDFCWEILKGICGSGDDDDRTPGDIAERYTERVMRSELDMDGGTATIAMNKELWYFLLMPEPDRGWKPKLAYKDEYADILRYPLDIATVPGQKLRNPQINQGFLPGADGRIRTDDLLITSELLYH